MLGVTLSLGVADCDALCVWLAEVVPVFVGERVCDTLGVFDCDGVELSVCEHDCVGEGVTVSLGVSVGDGLDDMLRVRVLLSVEV